MINWTKKIESASPGQVVIINKKQKDAHELNGSAADNEGGENENSEEKGGVSTVDESNNVAKKELGESTGVLSAGSVKPVKKKIVKQKVADKKEEITGQHDVSPANAAGVKTFIRKKVAKKVPVAIAVQKEDEGMEPEVKMDKGPECSEDKPKGESDSKSTAVVQDPTAKTTAKKKVIKRVVKRKVTCAAANEGVSDSKKDDVKDGIMVVQEYKEVKVFGDQTVDADCFLQANHNRTTSSPSPGQPAQPRIIQAAQTHPKSPSPDSFHQSSSPAHFPVQPTVAAQPNHKLSQASPVLTLPWWKAQDPLDSGKGTKPAETPTTLHGKSGHPTWILDSGANNHMTGELATFTSPVTSVNQSVCIADGSSIPIRSQGDARLSSDITLSSVYHDLTSKKIFGRGYERDELYYFGDPLPSHVWGSSPVTALSQHRYYVTFIDDYIRCTWVYLMHNGWEYITNEFRAELNKCDILQQLTCPYTPEQNGVAERKNRHIMFVVRCLLRGMRVPKYFWHMAILTATYLINRIPSRVLQGKALLHILQPVSTLFPIIPRVFWCTCFVHNRSPTRTKLDDKAVRCIFLGYSSMSKGYRCYDSVTRHMYHSLDVTFLETVLFFSDSTPSPGPGSEILAADDPIPPRSLPILEPPSSPPTPNGSLPSIASQDPSPRAQVPLLASSSESDMSPPLVSDIAPPRYPTRGEYLGNVCRLRKSIYGLKQSSRAWFHRFSEVVLFIGFQQCHSNHTCFIRRQSQGRCIIISVYVDDIIITGDDASGIVQMKCGLKKAFDIKDLGPLHYFLGIEVAQSHHGVSLSQQKYSLDLLQDTCMLGCRPTSTPMVPNLKISAELGELFPDPSIYQRLVGHLIYLTNTRPDLTFSVSISSHILEK
ncbi:hypothetical protein Acr_22g0002520 [Actinidia rufa]|uniref:Integrase catalytic domain-containing protein n=1 Tax=Actinidia rufa TaxID=165716 RepID=A0A7J0GJF1_9ERIC|nr:hypothetical protein Acr_22g0002520 [Actinidia rufa]